MFEFLIRMLVPILVTSLLLGCESDSGNSSDGSSSETIVDMGFLESEKSSIILTDEFGADYEDVVRYKFQAEAGISYSIDIENDDASEKQVTVHLQAPDCIGSTSSPGQLSIGRIRLESFEFSTPNDCELELHFSLSRFLAGGNYFSLRLNIVVGTEDGLVHDTDLIEPNNTFSSAFKIESGTSYQNYTGHYDDYDYFKIDALAGDTLNITIPAHPAPSTGPLFLQVFDANQNPLTNDLSHFSTAGRTEDLDLELTSDGPVYIKTFNKIEGVARTYFLIATITE